MKTGAEASGDNFPKQKFGSASGGLWVTKGWGKAIAAPSYHRGLRVPAHDYQSSSGSSKKGKYLQRPCALSGRCPICTRPL